MTAVGIFLALSFGCCCWFTWLAWRTPAHIGIKPSRTPSAPARGAIVDRLA